MDRFDLESRIMDCWNVVEDVKTVLSMADHREVSEDELANALLGIHTLYQMKFEQLWATFETLCPHIGSTDALSHALCDHDPVLGDVDIKHGSN